MTSRNNSQNWKIAVRVLADDTYQARKHGPGLLFEVVGNHLVANQQITDILEYIHGKSVSSPTAISIPSLLDDNFLQIVPDGVRPLLGECLAMIFETGQAFLIREGTN